MSKGTFERTKPHVNVGTIGHAGGPIHPAVVAALLGVLGTRDMEPNEQADAGPKQVEARPLSIGRAKAKRPKKRGYF